MSIAFENLNKLKFDNMQPPACWIQENREAFSKRNIFMLEKPFILINRKYPKIDIQIDSAAIENILLELFIWSSSICKEAL